MAPKYSVRQSVWSVAASRVAASRVVRGRVITGRVGGVDGIAPIPATPSPSPPCPPFLKPFDQLPQKIDKNQHKGNLQEGQHPKAAPGAGTETLSSGSGSAVKVRAGPLSKYLHHHRRARWITRNGFGNNRAFLMNNPG
jgi:hypothetical protein